MEKTGECSLCEENKDATLSLKLKLSHWVGISAILEKKKKKTGEEPAPRSW